MLIAWQDTGESIITYARYQMLQLWAVGMARLYLNLASFVALIAMVVGAVIIFFIPGINLILGILQMVWLAYLVYLARPSVGLKKKHYRAEFGGYNLALSVGAYSVAVGTLCALIPWYVWPVCVSLSPLFFLFLYDLPHEFPGNFLHALRQAGRMGWALVPLVVPWTLVLEAVYVLPRVMPHAVYIVMALALPIHVAFVTLVYTVSLHKHFEWYYD